MIKTETYEVNGTAFVRTYSDANRYVVRDGISYDEARDPASLGRTYTEGDVIRDEGEDNGPYLPAQDALDIIMGEG